MSLEWLFAVIHDFPALKLHQTINEADAIKKLIEKESAALRTNFWKVQ
jgi:hypothetical protein